MQLYGVHDEHTTKDAQVCTDKLPSLVEEALEIAHLLQLLHGGREVCSRRSKRTFDTEG
jgi:hypothetical protein